MKKVFYIVIFQILTSLGFALEIDDFHIIKDSTNLSIQLGDTIESVREKLGEPQKEMMVKKSGDEPASYNMEYCNLLIQYNDKNKVVKWFEITGAGYSSKRGLKVGDSLTDAYRLYGEAIYYKGPMKNSIEEIVMYRFEIRNDTPWEELAWHIIIYYDKNEKIKQIGMYSS